MPAGPQRIMPPDVSDFGSKPIPEGTVRFNHYTWGRNVPGIRAEGLKRSHSEEKFARGGTESPQVFATAGHPGRALQDAAHGDRHYIEGYAHAEQLDIGRPYGHLNGQQLGEHMRGLEERKSVITMHGDIPPHQIVQVHEPWHQTYRYLRDDPSHEANVMAGNYDNTEPSLDTAMRPIKTALAAKVMLGGKLQGKAW